MQKYIMATALALVLSVSAGSAAFAIWDIHGVPNPGEETPTVTGKPNVPPGIADRHAPFVGAAGIVQSAYVNPGYIRARADLFKYYLANGTLPDTLNLDRLGTDKVGLLAIFENAKKTGAGRMNFISRLQGYDVSKIDFKNSDFWGLGFTSADSLRMFTQGYINYVFGEIFDPGFSDPRSDFMFYTANEQKLLRTEIFGVVGQ